jgi:hypothetical protein
VGLAYWFDVGHGIMSALLADYDQEQFNNYSPAVPDNKKYGLHTLINF